jgi:hypothetical protein
MAEHGITYQNIEFTSKFVLHFSPLAMSSCFTIELQRAPNYETLLCQFPSQIGKLTDMCKNLNGSQQNKWLNMFICSVLANK